MRIVAMIIVAISLLVLLPTIALAGEAGRVQVAGPTDLAGVRIDQSGLTIDVKTDHGVQPLNIGFQDLVAGLDRQLVALGLPVVGDALGEGSGGSGLLMLAGGFIGIRMISRLLRGIVRLAHL